MCYSIKFKFFVEEVDCCYITLNNITYGPFTHKSRVIQFLYQKLQAKEIDLSTLNQILWETMNRLSNSPLAILSQASLDLNASIPVLAGTPISPIY